MGKDNDEAAGGFGSVFRDRLTYLMNGNKIKTQERADEIDISRPAVRKYLKPNDRREVTVPSALVVSRIARYFRTTPNFLLGFDEAADSEDAQRAGESVGEFRPAVGIYGVVAGVGGVGDGTCADCYRARRRDGNHYHVAVGHHGGFHVFLAVSALGHLCSRVGKRTFAEERPELRQIRLRVFHAELFAVEFRKFQLLCVLLPVQDAERARGARLGRELVQQHRGVEPARIYDQRFSHNAFHRQKLCRYPRAMQAQTAGFAPIAPRLFPFWFA